MQQGCVQLSWVCGEANPVSLKRIPEMWLIFLKLGIFRQHEHSVPLLNFNSFRPQLRIWLSHCRPDFRYNRCFYI